MEKRRNTLDRWQRLRFGRRATSNPPEDKKVSDIDVKRSSDKSERLRELTELLKASRNPSQQGGLNDIKLIHDEAPPVPPPRKPRTSLTNSGSIEKFIDTSASESGSPTMNTKYDHSVNEKNQKDSSASSYLLNNSLIETLRPNTSLSCLESISKVREKEKIMLPVAEENTLFKDCEMKNVNTATATESLQRPESRSVVGSYAQKAIPFRSASFSQIDYSSGKYIRSALGALKASLIKAKSPPPSVERKKNRSRSSSPEAIKQPECTNIWIPLKGPCDKRNDLNLDLIDVTATSNIILEEENENSPTSCNSDSNGFMVGNDRISSFIPKTERKLNLLTLNVMKAAEMTTDSPPDEGLTIQGVDNNYFQTASTCLIPIPVYECARQEPENTHLGDKWINACEVDSEKVLNEIANVSQTPSSNEIPAFAEIQRDDQRSHDNTTEYNKKISKRKSKTDELNVCDELRKTQSPTLDIDDLPAIAVTPGSSISGSSFEEIENNPNQQMSNDYVVEVRKRYSSGDKSNSENRSSDGTQSTSTSTSGTNSPKAHHDEKRRIDKSKRRKGIYIQWAALDKHNKELSAVSWSGNDNINSQELNGKILPIDGNCQPIWPISAYRNENAAIESNNKSQQTLYDAISPEICQTNSNIKRRNSNGKNVDDNQTPTFDAFTPDSESTKSQKSIWTRKNSQKARRQSLTLQSSEEKDESLSTSSPPTSKPPSKLFVLRSDSISDNEMSDRTPPPRDRASQSPAPDQDLKRYSKRPLRGPYGQMLEAEMKKPAKQNYDGLLEELNRSER